MSRMKLLPGYTLVRPIEMGGMTNLCVAKNPANQLVVFRMLRKELANDRKTRKSFISGIEILDKLDNPHIIRQLDTGKIDGLPYCILEYIEGANLREMIVGRNEALFSHPLPIVKQLAAAVAYLHRQGILHMDLKPENILLDKDIRVTLIDFDLALPHQGKPIKLKTLPGTKTYLAPEVLTGKTVDERSEVYSFGLVSYELLTGQKPFQANSPAEYERALCSPRVEAVPLTRHRTDLPASLVSIVHKCLAKQPSDRYPSMAFVLRDLGQLP